MTIDVKLTVGEAEWLYSYLREGRSSSVPYAVRVVQALKRSLSWEE